MNTESPKETFVERHVTYTLEVRRKFFIIEHVPARVCVETGEQLFSPETVERLQRTIWGRKQPNRILETPVFEFSSPTRRSSRTPDKLRKTPRVRADFGRGGVDVVDGADGLSGGKEGCVATDGACRAADGG